MSLALTVQMKVMNALVESLQSAERESRREPPRGLPGIPAPFRHKKVWNALDRFAFLRDWVTINFHGIVRRASHERFYVDDVLGMIPPYLEPEVAVLGAGSVLAIGTCEHPDRLAVPCRSIQKLGEYRAWFDTDESFPPVPAIVRSLGQSAEVVSRGRVRVANIDKEKPGARFIIITRKPIATAAKAVWD